MKTKKIISLLLAMVMLLSIMAGLGLSAYAEESGDYYYELLEDGTAEIWGYWGSEADLVIPAELDGHAVTSIGDYALSGCEMASVEIPDSITNIGPGAFAFCSNLTSIAVGEDNENYTVQDGVLFNKDQTELLAYPAGLEGSSYSVPADVTSIADGAFAGSALADIDIPAGVENIEFGAFTSCSGLASINVDENNGNYSSQDGVLFNKDKTEIITYPLGKENSSYAIPDTVTAIRDGLFTENANLTSVVIPDSVTYIGSYAFGYCENLAEVVIGNGVTDIAYGAFSGTAITEIVIPDSVKNVESDVFESCFELTSITFGSSVESIDGWMFIHSDNVQSIYILNRDSEISDEHEIPKTVTIYGYTDSTAQAYAEKNGLKFVAIDEETEEPTTEEPATEAPSTVESTTEEAATEAPATEAPKDEPATAEPTTAKPATEPTTKAESTTKPNTTDKPDSGKSPSTGAESKGLLAFAAIALAGGVVMIVKKREQD